MSQLLSTGQKGEKKDTHTPGASTLATLTAAELETSTGWFEKLCFSGKRAELPGRDESARLLEKPSSGLVGGGDGGRRSGENGIGSVRTGGVPGENVIDLQYPYQRFSHVKCYTCDDLCIGEKRCRVSGAALPFAR